MLTASMRHSRRVLVVCLFGIRAKNFRENFARRIFSDIRANPFHIRVAFLSDDRANPLGHFQKTT
jgi:hypothetical protein